MLQNQWRSTIFASCMLRANTVHEIDVLLDIASGSVKNRGNSSCPVDNVVDRGPFRMYVSAKSNLPDQVYKGNFYVIGPSDNLVRRVSNFAYNTLSFPWSLALYNTGELVLSGLQQGVESAARWNRPFHVRLCLCCFSLWLLTHFLVNDCWTHSEVYSSDRWRYDRLWAVKLTHRRYGVRRAYAQN